MSPKSTLTDEPYRARVPIVADMPVQLPVQRVEVSFVGAPPAARTERASGVSAVAADGSAVLCLVAGGFQPFLEVLRGHEAATLQSTLPAAASSQLDGDI